METRKPASFPPALALVATILVASIAHSFAQSAPREPRKPTNRNADRGGRGGPPDLVFQALDADRDGALSKTEIQSAAAILKTLDKNNDGKLTQDELAGDRGRGKGKGGGKGRRDKPRRDRPQPSDK